MNKTDMTEKVAATAELTKVQAGRAIDAVVEAIQGALKAGDTVNLIGFGTFSVGERAARTGRNPQTGAPMEIAAARLPRFRPGKGLKDAVAAVGEKSPPSPAAAPASAAVPVPAATKEKDKEHGREKEKSSKKK
ncbi:MAG: HU family DNA-binding protein [Magnetococcales bacterium]|nr:HU family DNA-binding protein [Magnetococcales bacterium]